VDPGGSFKLSGKPFKRAAGKKPKAKPA
jgi:hypothetical protein